MTGRQPAAGTGIWITSVAPFMASPLAACAKCGGGGGCGYASAQTHHTGVAIPLQHSPNTQASTMSLTQPTHLQCTVSAG